VMWDKWQGIASDWFHDVVETSEARGEIQDEGGIWDFMLDQAHDWTSGDSSDVKLSPETINWWKSLIHAGRRTFVKKVFPLGSLGFKTPEEFFKPKIKSLWENEVSSDIWEVAGETTPEGVQERIKDRLLDQFSALTRLPQGKLDSIIESVLPKSEIAGELEIMKRERSEDEFEIESKRPEPKDNLQEIVWEIRDKGLMSVESDWTPEDLPDFIEAFEREGYSETFLKGLKLFFRKFTEFKEGDDSAWEEMTEIADEMDPKLRSTTISTKKIVSAFKQSL